MKNLEAVRGRYLKEPLNKQLGHLASDLARIYGFLEDSKNEKAVEDVLEESKFFIEWTAPAAPFKVQALLSEIQSKLALWHYYFLRGETNSTKIGGLKKATKNWSAQLLEISGLVKI